MEFNDRNVVLRIVKPYPEARSHIYTGQVIDYDGNFVAFDGCVMHFGRPSTDDPSGGLTISHRAVRWVALQRVEYIRELPDEMDPFAPDKMDLNADGSLAYPGSARPDLIPD